MRYKLEAVNEQRVKDGLEPFELPSLRRLQGWIRDWKAKNSTLFLSATSPGKARNKTMPSFGDFYAFVTGINQRWEYDGHAVGTSCFRTTSGTRSSASSKSTPAA